MSEGIKADFFLSRRGSVAATAREVTDVLTERGYKVVVQDYDIPLTANFVEAMHNAIQHSRDLIVLFTADYEASPYTRKEFTSFEADRVQSGEERRVVILRCEDVPLRGLFAPNVYQDLVGVDDPEERRRRIIAAAEGQSQAQKPILRPFVGVPPRTASFTGRATELDRLDAVLIGGDRPAAITQAPAQGSANVGRAALQGMGGVGKTALAVEYAYRYRDLYAGVWWCSAESRIDLLTGLAALARHLGAAADEADLEKAAKAGLRRLAEQRATHLLVYDNVTSPDEITDLLPAAGARVLITSRFPDWSGWAEEVSLDVLPPAEAVAFLEARAARPDAAGAKVLAEALGRLPLALDHAAAYCRRTQMRFADYAAKAASLIAAAPRGAAYPRSVSATFDLAIAAAVAACSAAEALMAYLGQCAPERIPMMLVEGAIDDEAERMEALLALADVSLVRSDPFEDGTPAWTVHRLVQAVARAKGAAAITGRLTARLTEIYPQDDDRNRLSGSLYEQLTPHVIEHGMRELPDAADYESVMILLLRAGEYLQHRAAYPQARSVFDYALAKCETVFGARHKMTADCLSDLSLLLREQGDFLAALPLNERSLAIREEVLGPEHRDTATSLNNLALLLQDRNELAAARPLFERALAIKEKVLGSEHPRTAVGLDNLGAVLFEQGDLEGARTLFERALAVQEKILGPEGFDTAQSLNNLAVVLKAQDNHAAAHPLYERALAIHEKLLGPEHHLTAMSLRNLAALLQLQGDLTTARPLLERAVAIYGKTLGPDHAETAIGLHNLAHLLHAAGQTSEAEPLFRQAVAAGEKAMGRDHPATQRFQRNLGRLLLDTGRRAEALSLGEVALATHQAAFGPDHAVTKDSARLVADALDALDRGEEAADLRVRYGL